MVFTIQWSISSLFVNNIFLLEPYKKQILQVMAELSGQQYASLVNVITRLLSVKIRQLDREFYSDFFDLLDSGRLDDKLPPQVLKMLKINHRVIKKLTFVKLQGFPHIDTI